VINGGAAVTNTAAVILTLSATDSGSGVAAMQFSNDNLTWSALEPYAATKGWTLTTGDGPKTVYGKFKDNADNWSSTISSTNTIILDTAPPTVSITSPANGYTNNATQVLNYSTSDGTVVVKVDGIAAQKMSGDMLDLLTEGSHTVRVESSDSANIWVCRSNFTVDTILPAITITSPIWLH
jgi:hypothetical protein